FSWFGSFQSFLPLFLGYWAGNLLGKGYFHHLMITGSSLFIFSWAYIFLLDHY
ncbi:hypothetical protein B0H17DRAFT_936374, partial [Mycena rosella]